MTPSLINDLIIINFDYICVLYIRNIIYVYKVILFFINEISYI